MDTPNGTDPVEAYDRFDHLRALGSAELAPLVRDFVLEWLPRLRVEAKGPLDLAYEGVSIPVVGDVSQPRVSQVLLTAELTAGAQSLQLTWPKGSGALVLRQQRVDAPLYRVSGRR